MISGLALILCCQPVGEAVTRGLALPIPGPVLGLLLLFLVLLLRDRVALLAVVALAIPLYENRRLIVAAILPMIAALLIGSLTAIVSVVVLAKLAGLPDDVVLTGAYEPSWHYRFSRPWLRHRARVPRHRHSEGVSGP